MLCDVLHNSELGGVHVSAENEPHLHVFLEGPDLKGTTSVLPGICNAVYHLVQRWQQFLLFANEHLAPAVWL